MIEEQRRGLRTWLARITGRSMGAPMTGASMAEPDDMAAMEPASMTEPEMAAMEPASMAPDMAAMEPASMAPDMAAPESMEPTTPSMSDPARMPSSATQL